MADYVSEGAIQTPFLEFRELLALYIKELESAWPERHSTDYYCLVYLRRVSKRAHACSSPRDVSASVRGLIRFYVDSIEPGSELGRRCEAVIEAHREALRLERRD